MPWFLLGEFCSCSVVKYHLDSRLVSLLISLPLPLAIYQFEKWHTILNRNQKIIIWKSHSNTENTTTKIENNNFNNNVRTTNTHKHTMHLIHKSFFFASVGQEEWMTFLFTRVYICCCCCCWSCLYSAVLIFWLIVPFNINNSLYTSDDEKKPAKLTNSMSKRTFAHKLFASHTYIAKVLLHHNCWLNSHYFACHFRSAEMLNWNLHLFWKRTTQHQIDTAANNNSK